MTTKDYPEEISDIVNRAGTELIICSKKLPSEYYGQSEVVEAIEEALKRGVSVHILTGPERQSTPPYWDKVNTYTGRSTPYVNFIVGSRKPRHSFFGLIPTMRDIIFSPYEEGDKGTSIRRNTLPAGHYLREKFIEAIETLKPYSTTPNLTPSTP